MSSIKYSVSKQLMDFSLNDFVSLYQQAKFFLKKFIKECTIPDSPAVSTRHINKQNHIQVTASQKKAFARAYFNPPKRNILLQGLRLLLE